MRRVLPLFGLLMFGCLTISANSAWGKVYERRVEKHFDVETGGRLKLQTDQGSVRLQGWEPDKVDVVVTMEADSLSEEQAGDWFDRFELSFDQRGKDVYVRGERKDRLRWRRNRLRVSFDIQVPRKYNLDVSTAGGDVSATELSGEIKLKTSGGDVSIGQTEGPVSAKTSGGDISLEGAAGEVSLRTSGGDISVEGVKGPVEAHTSGGDISAHGVAGDSEFRTSGGDLKLRKIKGNLTAGTSGGDIQAELFGQIDTPAELKTSGGDITLRIDPTLKADVDAATSGGHVSTEVPLLVKGTLTGSQIKGKLNGGGELITLKTCGGDIKIRAHSGTE